MRRGSRHSPEALEKIREAAGRPETRRARDAALDEAARAEGWTVLHFSSKEIKNDPAACGSVVAQFVTERLTAQPA